MWGRRFLIKRRLQRAWRWFTRLSVELRLILFCLWVCILFLLLLFFTALFVEVWRLLPSTYLDMSRCNCVPKENSVDDNDSGEIHKGKVNLLMDVNDLMGGGPLVLPQTHKAIERFLWLNRHIRPRSGLMYELSNPGELAPVFGEPNFILRTIGHKIAGTFIECRAFDGVAGSKTLYLEHKLAWIGLLIEPDPKTYEKLVSRNRVAWTSNVCLSTKPYPYRAYIENGTVLGDIHDYAAIKKVGPDAEIIQCMPFYSLITTLGFQFHNVDYLSLNWGGDEHTILMTLPFKNIKFQIISIPGRTDKADEAAIIKFMDSQGYSAIPENKEWASSGLPDLFFIPKTGPTGFVKMSD
ncbi:unnamed protein product [Orchesella dallaii]|uniref:Protein Star n=1 Tax=Orchesella dallaii TaxID=48710 RepID=A0ABP1R4J7_9HEXA